MSLCIIHLIFCSIILQADTAQRGVQCHTKYISTGHAKIAVIGTGFVGATAAYALMLKNITAELILVDIDEKRCEGEVLDLSDALSFCSAYHVCKGTLKDAARADIIIITAGVREKPGQTRLDSLKTNRTIMSSIMDGMNPINPHAVILVVSNPVDIMTYLAQQLSDLPKNQVFGSGTHLDTQRLCGALAEKTGVAQQSIQAYILGEHGDSQFPAWSSARIAGRPIALVPGIDANQFYEIADQTRKKGFDILKLKNATYYGIGACVADICENIIFNQKRIMLISWCLNESGVCLSLPAIVGENGIETILQIPLNEDEQERLKKSEYALQTIISQL